MKCGETLPGASNWYKACTLDLGHRGQHDYCGQRWSRPELAEPDWDVEQLLEDTAPRDAYGLAERSYPVIVTETVTRVLWVEAENEDQALKYWGDDPTDLDLRDTEVLDGSLEFERADKYQRDSAFQSARHGNKVGPQIACPDCARTAFRRAWFHDPYRKCHGPITWKRGGRGRPIREYQQTPVGGAQQAVAA